MANPFLANGECSPQSIYSVLAAGADPNAPHGWHKVGTRGWTEDGRVFYYGRNTSSSALAPGKLMVRPDITAEHTECDVTAGTLGSYQVTGITIGAVALTLNQYRDGYLMITDGTGEGHTYRIKEHAAFDASATTVAVTLYDQIAVALDTNSTVSFIKNGYDTPQISVSDQDDIPVGVPTVNIPAGNTTTQYGWFQTWGEAAVLYDEAVSTLGTAVVIGDSTGGAVSTDNTATTVAQEAIVGRNITAGVDTEYSPTFLMIRP